MSKRDYKIIGITVAILFAIYWLFLRNSQKTPTTNISVSERPITAPTVDPNGVNQDGKPLKTGI